MRLTDYNAVAPDFDANKERLRIAPDLELERVLTRPFSTILDLGCGTGNYLQAQQTAFPDSSARWIGLDPFSGMLTIARTKINASFAQGFAERLPYPAHTFDYTAVNFAFHHFWDKNQALDEITRTLKQDGVLRIRNVCPERIADWWVYRFFPETVVEDEKRFWSLQKLENGLQARGFLTEIVVDEQEFQRPLSKVKEEALRRDLSQLAILTTDEYARGLEKIERRLIDDPDTVVFDRITFMLCMARRE